MKTGQAIKSSGPEPRLGIFLCECGEEIAAKLDLPALARMLAQAPRVGHVEILPFTCLTPGLDRIREMIERHGLNRIIVAGCESRILHKKFDRALEALGVEEEEIDLVNLRDYVARVNRGTPTELAGKGAKLIRASQAWLETLKPTPPLRIDYQGPVLVLGGGIAGFGAAQELVEQGVETVIALNRDLEEETSRAHSIYPGDDHCFDLLAEIIKGVSASPLVRTVRVGEVKQVSGRFGGYTVTFAPAAGEEDLEVQAGAIIAALDWEVAHQLPEFGHDGDRIICQVEMNEFIKDGRPLSGKIVFWINDAESGQPFAAHLSLEGAWNMAAQLREKKPGTKVSILYDGSLAIPFGTFDRGPAPPRRLYHGTEYGKVQPQEDRE
jgi:heterodisulfide reductase subunit A-like polyferredoxin